MNMHLFLGLFLLRLDETDDENLYPHLTSDILTRSPFCGEDASQRFKPGTLGINGKRERD